MPPRDARGRRIKVGSYAAIYRGGRFAGRGFVVEALDDLVQLRDRRGLSRYARPHELVIGRAAQSTRVKHSLHLLAMHVATKQARAARKIRSGV